MSIIRGDCVRPNNPGPGLPFGSVWRVTTASGGLIKLTHESGGTHLAGSAPARLFCSHDFDKVVMCSGQWVDVRDVDPMRVPSSFYGSVLTGRMSAPAPAPQNPPKPLFSSADAVTTATVAAEQASNATAAIDSLLEAARKLEAEREADLREAIKAAKAAKAKADKEAAARAKAEEARKALAAKLHADRCLADATLALIAEVSRLNNGGSEQVASHSIAQHADQLQALAKSYGYRIAKPSMLAQVIKL